MIASVPQIAGCLHRYYHLPEIFDARGRPLAFLMPALPPADLASALWLPQQLRQLGDVRRDTPRFIEGLEHDLDQRRAFEAIDNVWNAPDWVFVERKLMNIPRWVEWWPLAIFLLLFAIVFVTVAFRVSGE
jgi:hypothetical protein